MPRIKEFNSNVNVQGPIQMRGANDNPEFGRGLERFGAAVSGFADVMNKRQEQSEISDLAAKTSQADVDFTNRWKTEAQQGTIDSQKFLDDYNAHMDQIREGISTNGAAHFFDRQRAQSTESLMKSVFSAQAEVAGAKAKQNAIDTKDNFSAVLRTDPSSLPIKMQQYNEHIDELVRTNMLPSQVADAAKRQGKEDLTKASIRGWIDLNPEAAKRDLANGKWDDSLNGDLKNQLLGEADQQIRGLTVEAERQKAFADKQLKEEQKKTEADFIERATSGTLTPKQILASNLDPRDKEHYINMVRENSTRAVTTPNYLKVKIWDRIHNLPDGDPNKITDSSQIYALSKQMSIPDMKMFVNELTESKSPEGKAREAQRKALLKEAESKLVKKDPVTGLADPSGQEAYSQFITNLTTAEGVQRKNGKPLTDLYDPNSPNYFGKTVQQKSTLDIQQAMIDRIKGETARKTNTPPPPPEGRVRMKDKDGKTGTVPAARVEEYKKQGYQVVN